VEHDRPDHKELVMSDQNAPAPPEPMGAEHPDVLAPGEIPVPVPPPGSDEPDREAIESPAKVMRIGSMVKQLLDEVRAAPLDERSRERLAEIYGASVEALAGALSPDLQTELRELVPPFADGEVPSEAELRVAQAQLVGWLEGLFHGIQATLFAQQLAARQQLEQMRGQLMPGQPAPPEGGRDRPGTYL
jgi:Bacterial proteasome activator